VASIALLGLGLLAGVLYLGHPERIFGAFANLHSVLSRELIAFTVALLLEVTFLSKIRSKTLIGKILPVASVLVGVGLACVTAQLIYGWLNGEVVIG
jgi:DMSO reductase anchor subunit